MILALLSALEAITLTRGDSSMRISDLLKLLGALSALTCALPAQASFLNGTAAGLASPASTNQFTTPSLAVDTMVTNQFAGVMFSPNLYYDPQDGTAFGISGISLGNFTFPTQPAFVNPVTISFAAPVAGAAFQMAGDGTPYSFAAYDGATLVDSGTTTVSFSTASSFFGFTDPLTSIVITQAGAGGGSYYLLGNLQQGASLSSVPEPGAAALALAGLGLLGLAFALRGRRLN